MGSSAVNMMSSMERRGRTPAARSDRIASRPPSTPTTPSKRPASGMASMCEPVATAASSGSSPSHRAKVLPTASTRTARPAASMRSIIQARARMSVSVNSTRVTDGYSVSENPASSSISRDRRRSSIAGLTPRRPGSSPCR